MNLSSIILAVMVVIAICLTVVPTNTQWNRLTSRAWTLGAAQPEPPSRPVPPLKGLTKPTPLTIERAVTANYFDLAHVDISHRPEGDVLSVWWNAFTQSADSLVPLVLVRNLGPATFAGTEYATLLADVVARTTTLRATRSADEALSQALHDAVLGALDAKGLLGQ